MKGLGVLKFYKLHKDVISPSKATKGSACFDIHAHLIENESLVSHENVDARVKDGCISLAPNARILIPTGLVFDIPEYHSMRIHPRSGLSFKEGLMLANQEGIVDSDYKEEVFIPIINAANGYRKIENGQRIAQAELINDLNFQIKETKKYPAHTTDRRAGFGSTGK
jgi:dUTP pyrophosphatase